ncbi:MAG: L-threonylcarbamoyladenylate synthase [Desulfocapsaceae bacterium]
MIRRETSRCKIVTTDNPDYSSDAAAVIRSGGIAAIPTETSYGLAVDPFNGQALKQLFAIKRRPSNKPVLVLIDGVEHLSRLISGIPVVYEPLIKRFWPGPLTLIFPARPTLPSLLTAGSGTIGVRISSNKSASAICHLAGGAITATSANISGEQPARTVKELVSSFKESLDLIVDGGGLDTAPPSTILNCRDNRLGLVREGGITLEDIDNLQS